MIYVVRYTNQIVHTANIDLTLYIKKASHQKFGLSGGNYNVFSVH